MGIKTIQNFKVALRHPIVNNAAVIAVSQYIATGLGFFATVVVVRILGPTNYGIAALIMAYPLLVWSFVGIKSSSVTTRYISTLHAAGRDEEINSICKLGYGLDFFASVIAFILVGATSLWITQHVLHMSQKAWLMTAYAASLPFLSLAGTSWAGLSSLERWRWLAALQILDKLILFIIVFGLLLRGFGVYGIVIGTAIGHIIFGLLTITIATYIFYHDRIGLWWRASLSNIVSLRKELSLFFGWQYLAVSLSGLVGQVPLMLLGYLRGPEEAGFYRLASSLMMFGSYLETSLGQITYPVLSGYWGTGERESLKKTLKRWTLRIGFPIGVVLLITIPIFPILLPVVFGSSYSPMILGAQVMAVGVAVNAVFFWLIQFYYASGKISLWTKKYALYTTLVIGLGWFCIQWWGFLGLAVLITVAKIVFTLSMALGFKESPLRRPSTGKYPRGNHKIACFTWWFPVHNNPRYTGLFPKLTSTVKFYKITFSRHRLIRATQYRLWHVLKKRFIYPIVLWAIGQRHEALFTVDPHQIPACPRNKSVVVDMDDPLFTPTEARLLNLPQVKAIVVTMEKMRAIFQQLGVVRPIYVIPQGVSMEDIDSYKIAQVRAQFKGENDTVVGYLAPTLTLSCDGHRRARQGSDDLDLLLAAVEDAWKAEPRMKLWLMGEPSKSLKDYVAEDHKPWIKLFGYIPHFDILNYVSNFDIAVYPRTQSELIRFRVKIVQYMACGVPIISTNAEENFIIKEAGCGIICDSQKDFTEALVMLAQSPESRLELGKAGQRYAAENLNWSMLAQRYEQIFSQL